MNTRRLTGLPHSPERVSWRNLSLFHMTTSGPGHQPSPAYRRDVAAPSSNTPLPTSFPDVSSPCRQHTRPLGAGPRAGRARADRAPYSVAEVWPLTQQVFLCLLVRG